MVQHRGTEGTENTENNLTRRVIGAAIEVHRTLGPGLLESVYQECLTHELSSRGLSFRREVPLTLQYKGHTLRTILRADLLIESRVIVETKALESLAPVHSAQLLSYLRLSNIRIGLLINFNVETLVHGIRRVVNG